MEMCKYSLQYMMIKLYILYNKKTNFSELQIETTACYIYFGIFHEHYVIPEVFRLWLY